MEINYVSIGERIREIRMQKRWTQAFLAERAAVEPSNISHIERAATKVSLPTLIAIANAFANSGGTAFPTCLNCCPFLPVKIKSSGKLCNLADSLIVGTLLNTGWK